MAEPIAAKSVPEFVSREEREEGILSRLDAVSDALLDGEEPADAAPVDGEEPADAAPVDGEEPADADKAPDDAPVDDTPAIEYETIKHGGHEFRITKTELKALAAKGYDYTLNSQKLADERRALDTEKVRFQQDISTQQQLTQDYGVLTVLDAQIQDAEKAAQTPTDDIAERVLRSNHLRDLKDAAAEIAGRIQQARTQQVAAAQAQFHEAALKAEAELAHPEHGIKGWGPALYRSLLDYGARQGFTAQEVQQVVDARVLRMLHKAYLYDSAKSRTGEHAQAPSKKPAAPVKPGARQPNSQQDNQRYVDARKALRKSGGRDARAAQAAIAALLK